jgi:hypothetical protein
VSKFSTQVRAIYARGAIDAGPVTQLVAGYGKAAKRNVPSTVHYLRIIRVRPVLRRRRDGTLTGYCGV